MTPPRAAGQAAVSPGRSFGLVFAIVFVVIGAWPLLDRAPTRVWSFGVAGLLAVVAVLVPVALDGPARLWLRFGLLLGRVVSPVVLSIMYFLVFTPIGLLLRLAGKDLLRLKGDRTSASYWIPRDPPGPGKESFPRQF